MNLKKKKYPKNIAEKILRFRLPTLHDTEPDFYL